MLDAASREQACATFGDCVKTVDFIEVAQFWCFCYKISWHNNFFLVGLLSITIVTETGMLVKSVNDMCLIVGAQRQDLKRTAKSAVK